MESKRNMKTKPLPTHPAPTRRTLAALASVLLGGPLLLAFEPRGDEIGFAPEEGSAVSKHFGVQFDLLLGDLSVFVDGQDMTAMAPGDFEVTTEIDIQVVDTYVSVDSGVPLELVRLYDAMEAMWETPDDSGEADDGTFAELAGKSVRFKWNADAESYELSYVDEEGDEDALEGLSVDMDFRSVLPEGGLGSEVSEGDTWTLEGRQVPAMMLYGAELDSLDDVDLGDDELGLAELFEAELVPQLEALMDELGATCTYNGNRDADGRRVGSIGIRVEGSGDIDLSALILGMVEAQGEGVDIDVQIDEAIVSISLEGEGELLWDLEAGRFDTFEMTPELEVLIDVVVGAEVMGETHDAEVSIELLGEGVWSAEASAR